MKNERKCWGTGKAIGYGCGKIIPQVYFDRPNRTYGIGRSCGCFAEWLTSESGQKMVANATLKATRPRLELEKAETERKETKSLRYLITNTITACHDYIKARDKGRPCVSCETDWSSSFQAGHFKKAELYSSMKFNEKNIHGQCVRCNNFKDGNVQPYAVKLADRYSMDFVDELHRLAHLDKHDGSFKWDRAELNKIREYYKQKLKKLNASR